MSGIRYNTKDFLQSPATKHDWETPDYLFKWADKRWGPFNLDAAASAENTKCDEYFTEENDALSQNWATSSNFGTKRVWCNPPYGSMYSKFILKAIEELEAGHIFSAVFLIPARVDTKIFQDAIRKNASEIYFIRGRVKFVNGDEKPTPSTFPSCLVWFTRQSVELKGERPVQMYFQGDDKIESQD